MKITGIQLRRHTIPYQPRSDGGERSCDPLDIWPEFADETRSSRMRATDRLVDGMLEGVFLVLTTDEGIEGLHGPIENRAQLLTVMDGLAALLVGRDPMENRMIWDILSRFDRHSRSGVMMMAISAVDIALWDLKGKILGQPVYRLLGGGRDRIRPYISMLGFPTEPAQARDAALQVRSQGFTAQKWFFRYGPGNGTAGIRKNLDLAFSLRDALGPDYELMFDCWMGWDIPYARTVFRELESVRPLFVEEVLRPHMVDGYRRLKAETEIPLAGGEHLYTRMEVNGSLRDGVFDVMQSDPEWCGGITEAMRIGDLCEVYQTRLLPHGHSLMPALHVVAAMSPDVSPRSEYLLHWMDRKTAFYRENRLGADGMLTLNDTPGLGEEIDGDRIAGTELVRAFEV